MPDLRRAFPPALVRIPGVIRALPLNSRCSSAHSRGLLHNAFRPHTEDEAARAQTSMAPSPQAGMIVIVEDPSIRRLLKNVLERVGHCVMESDTRRVIRLVKSREAAVKLLITNLPEAFSEIEGAVPILYLASSPDWELVRRSRGVRVLQKPFHTKELLEAVDAIADGSK